MNKKEGRGKMKQNPDPRHPTTGTGHRAHRDVKREEIISENRKEDIEDSPASSVDEVELIDIQAGRKRSYADENEGASDFGSEMTEMLKCFGTDMSKTLVTKRKRLEQFTQGSFKSSSKKIEDVWREQQTERYQQTGKFKKQMLNVLQQWETDVDKSKEQEEKLLNMFKQQLKLFQQGRIARSQRLKTVRQLYEHYVKGMDELEKNHQEQLPGVHAELKKEMALLQKKILMETQQQQMAHVKQSLQAVLFQ